MAERQRMGLGKFLLPPDVACVWGTEQERYLHGPAPHIRRQKPGRRELPWLTFTCKWQQHDLAAWPRCMPVAGETA